ncbi:glycosyltransferase [Vagococcus intermedius]|uniref:CDP-glycerol glycerophosphotransferase family protein n=1 Tax=Vagococcus intermedius TaxID=2991418 RepID=A0AAF0CVG8_9ENTE|nr:glycosyltransferase [Vagococcus intermedius]WEG73616.1 CDP-glycerol glycerophosphotransferase family protein [Vagococcus intermedius]WEG75700.1 CDP-glycerol glycerophosphotransferase family protein [Vagococcus intermedius]
MNKKILKRKINFVLDPLKKAKNVESFRRKMFFSGFIKEPIVSKTVFLEGYSGDSVTGNALALFEQMYQDSYFNEWKFIWGVKDMTCVPKQYAKDKRVMFVIKNSKEYVKGLATSEYLVTDTTFPWFFSKRAEQKMIMSWHGTPYKTIGVDIVSNRRDTHKNVLRNILHTDYFISPSQFFTDTILKAQDATNLYRGTILETGIPRTDFHFIKESELKEVQKLAGIDPQRKTVLYAPTYNDFATKGKAKSDHINKLIEDTQLLQESLGEDYQVLLKVHYFEFNAINNLESDIQLVDNSIDTNQLLPAIDMLITDYSSIFFDYLSLNRPIYFYFKNYDVYKEKRGLYLDLIDLPGGKFGDIESLSEGILSAETKESTNDVYIDRYAKFDDGKVSERVIDYIIKNQELAKGRAYQLTSTKQNILFYAGAFFTNGITESFIRLSEQLDFDKYNVTVILTGVGNTKKEKWETVARLPEQMNIIFGLDDMNCTLQEYYKYQMYLNRGIRGNKIDKETVKLLFNQERRRLFGNMTFDTEIDFSGYSSFWTSFISFGDATKKVIFQHSDMLAETEKRVKGRRPHKIPLQAVFPLYETFDKVISVSETSYIINKKNFEKRYRLEGKMDYIVNYLDAAGILEKAEDFKTIKFEMEEIVMVEVERDENYFDETQLIQTKPEILESDDLLEEVTVEPIKDVELVEETRIVTKELMVKKFSPTMENVVLHGLPWPSKDNVNYITVGRLSPEKNHYLLLDSFKEVLETQPNSFLYLVGAGTLEVRLKNYVKRHKMTQNVYFCGHMSNPFALMKHCDVFVLTSKYEGQALVVLEALTLGLKVVSTDIPGPNAILAKGYGELVEPTIYGLAQKLLQVVTSEKEYEVFDYNQYETDAINMFNEKILTK